MQEFLDEQLRSLTASWKPLLEVGRPAPTPDWEDWLEALLDLTSTPSEELLVRGALSAVIKSPAEITDHEVLHQLVAIGARAHGAAPLLVSQLTSSREEEMAVS